MIHIPSPFRVFDASAGAGKTFRLVQEYLSLCLKDDRSDGYRHILAVTFTNKAAAEMRERVFRMLREMSLPEDQRSEEAAAMIGGISQMTGISEDILASRSANVLRSMLHDYANISISTIDRFTHRLIRTFAHDLDLSTGFDLEMDTQRILEQAVDLVFSRAGTEEVLTELLLRFTNSRMDDEKSWDLFQSLLEVSRELISESSIEDIERLSRSSMEQLMAVQREMEKAKRDGLKRLREIGMEYEQLLHRFQLTIDDVKGKSRSGPSPIFLKWKKGEEADITEARQAYVDGNGDYFNAKGGPSLEVQEDIRRSATELIREGVEIQRGLRWKKEMAISLYGLALLGELAKEWEAIKQEENLLPISDFNRILNKEIKGVQAPYVFERLGERYRHFFLDEFQDTSVLQWENMWPLVENALSGGGTCMLVGDAKQSIYRWRNGDPEQFIALSKWEERDDLPFEARTIPMEENRRSRPNIVNFNNRFFEKAANWLDHPDYRELYLGAKQEPMSSKPGGYVEVSWISGDKAEDRLEEASERLCTLVENLIAEGHSPGSIAILVRTGKEGSRFATSLAEIGVDVVGSDTLYVRNSREVKLIYSSLRWVYGRENPLTRFDVLEGLVENGLVDVDPLNPHPFYSKFLGFNEEELIREISGLIPGWDTWSTSSSGLYTRVEHLARILGFLEDPNAFVQSFLDQVFSFSQRPNASLSTFFDWWERKAEGLSLDIPESDHAVKVLTLHKSKGLQFPIVIIPNAGWSDNGLDPVWMETPEDIPLERAKILPRKKDEDPSLKSAYEYGEQQARFDNLNLLYVGMTRPKDRLYIFTVSPDARGRRENSVAVNFDFLQGEADSETGIFSFGEITEPVPHMEARERTPIKWHSREWIDVARISRTAPQEWENRMENPRYWGNLVHRILEEVSQKEDIEPILSKWIEEGQITEVEADRAREMLDRLFELPEIREVFLPGMESFTERDLIQPGGRVLRPDRMVRTNEGWTILDYKTGEEDDKYVKQVEEYAFLLSEATGEPVRKMLVYLHSDRPHVIQKWN